MAETDPTLTRCNCGGSFIGLQQAAQVRADTDDNEPGLMSFLGPVGIVRRRVRRQHLVPGEPIGEL